MKILYIITGLGLGGAERVVVDLADKFYDNGHSVKIIYFTGDQKTFPKNKEIEIIKVNMFNLISLYKCILEVRNIILNYKPDIVHAHMFHANIISRITRLIVHFPRLINTSHSSNEGGVLRMFLYRISNFLVDNFTNVSWSAVKNFEKLKAVKKNSMLCVHNGIDIERFKYNHTGRTILRKKLNLNGHKIILAVGRFNVAKDYNNLLMACNLLKINNVCFKLLIAGDGELKDSIKKLIEIFDLNQNVTLLGTRNDIPDLMSASDVFVLSSKWEGFGLVLAEAMACERVVVSTDCGGTAEIVRDKGYLIEPQNPEKLYSALKNALELSEYDTIKLGVMARERIINEFSLESSFTKWQKIYKFI